MPNRLIAAFEKALNCAEKVKGTREKVTFRGVELDALFYDNPDDIGPGLGGTAQRSPIRVSVRIEDVELPIDHLEEITIRGEELAVLIPTIAEGRIDLLCGDPAAEGID